MHVQFILTAGFSPVWLPVTLSRTYIHIPVIAIVYYLVIFIFHLLHPNHTHRNRHSEATACWSFKGLSCHPFQVIPNDSICVNLIAYLSVVPML